MYQDLPGNAMELVIDENEQILYAVTLKNMRDFLSGDEKSDGFCFVTTERVYSYRLEKGEIVSKVCDIKDVEKVSYHVEKRKKELLAMLWCIPAALIAVLLYSVAKGVIFTGLAEGFAGVMFIANAVLLILLALAIIIIAFSRYAKSSYAVMDVKIKGDDEIISIKLPSAVTEEVKTFERELRRAKAMQNATNPEAFL